MAKLQHFGITALYERLSKDDDLRGESNSIQNQKKYLEDYAKKNNFNNIKHYVDDGFTGTNFNRPGFQEMISDVEAGKISTVIVKDMSRFGRNYLEVGFYTEMVFPKKNVRFIAINNGIDSDVATDNDFTPFLNIMNEWYAKDTSNKIKAIFNARMKEGLRCSGSIPYGYNRLPNDKQKLVKDPEASKVVARIFDLAAKGISVPQIASILEEDKVLIPSAYHEKYHPEQSNGIKYSQPYKWRATTLRGILERKEYLGHTVLKKTEHTNFKLKKRKKIDKSDWLIFKNTHEAIVDEATWQQAQKNLEKHRRKRVQKGNAKNHIFSGYLVCSDCGNRLRVASSSNSRGVEYYSFRCGNYASNSNKCTSHSIGEKTLEKLVLETVRRIYDRIDIDEKKFANELSKQIEEKKKEKPLEKLKELSVYEKRLEELNLLIKKLYENYILGALPEKQYLSFSKEYSSEQQELEIATKKIKEELEEYKEEPQCIEKFIEIIRAYKKPTELTEEMVRGMIDKIVVHDAIAGENGKTQCIEIYFNFVGKINLEYTKKELKDIAKEEERKKKKKDKRTKEVQKKYREKKKAERLAENEGHLYPKKQCHCCGKEFWPITARQIYCTKKCRQRMDLEKVRAKAYEDKGEHPFRQKKCNICGKAFWPVNGQEVLCSDECKKINRRKKQLEYYHKTKTAV